MTGDLKGSRAGMNPEAFAKAMSGLSDVMDSIYLAGPTHLGFVAGTVLVTVEFCSGSLPRHELHVMVMTAVAEHFPGVPCSLMVAR